MTASRPLALCVAVAMASVCLRAQAPSSQPPPPSFRAATDIVEVDVIVRDKAGHFVSDLSVDDFDLRDEGQPQQVQQIYMRLAGADGSNGVSDGKPASSTTPALTPNASAPAGAEAGPSRPPDLFVVVFDDAHMTVNGFKRTQAAALNMFTKQFRAGDFGGVVANGRIVNNRITSDRDELIKAVKSAQPNRSKSARAFDEVLWPRLTETEAVLIAVNGQRDALTDAINHACQDDPSMCQGGDPEGAVMSKARQMADSAQAAAAQALQLLQTLLTGLGKFDGRKTVLLMTEGFMADDSWSAVRDVVSTAARVNARIYTLDARGNTRGLVSVDDKIASDRSMRMLEQMDMGADSVNSLAVDTGGFVVRNTNMFDKAITQIVDDATNYYVLGYVPASAPDGKFHKIRVRVKRAGVSVRARGGYTASPRTVDAARGSNVARGFSRASNAPGTAPDEPVAPLAEPEMPAAPPSLTETVAASPPAASSTIRLRPDASKHLDLLLPNAAADKAAADGWAAYQRGDVVSARMALRVAVESPSAEAWVHYALGQADYALREYSEAVVEWEKVRGIATDFEPVYFDLVDGYVQLKDSDKAIRLLRDGVLRWPKDPEMYNALGVVQAAHAKLDDAIASFRKGIAAAPEEPTTYFNLGKALELRFGATRRYYAPTKRWIGNEKDRTEALENFQRYLATGGPYSQQARDGIERLKWQP